MLLFSPVAYRCGGSQVSALLLYIVTQVVQSQ